MGIFFVYEPIICAWKCLEMLYKQSGQIYFFLLLNCYSMETCFSHGRKKLEKVTVTLLLTTVISYLTILTCFSSKFEFTSWNSGIFSLTVVSTYCTSLTLFLEITILLKLHLTIQISFFTRKLDCHLIQYLKCVMKLPDVSMHYHLVFLVLTS